ncbi:MAG: hypothetical protein LC624_01635 [Halobacteriales archaeon]|nr:hypothetical protein [Halobacteriales archaeon]
MRLAYFLALAAVGGLLVGCTEMPRRAANDTSDPGESPPGLTTSAASQPLGLNASGSWRVFVGGAPHANASEFTFTTNATLTPGLMMNGTYVGSLPLDTELLLAVTVEETNMTRGPNYTAIMTLHTTPVLTASCMHPGNQSAGEAWLKVVRHDDRCVFTFETPVSVNLSWSFTAPEAVDVFVGSGLVHVGGPDSGTISAGK